MKIALFYHGYLPEEGGTGYVLNCLNKFYINKPDILYFFNPFDNGKFSFKIPELKKYSLKSIFSFLLNKKSLKLVLTSIWKVLNDNYTKFPDRIRILTYFLIKPQIFINTFISMKKILPQLKALNLNIILGGATSVYGVPLIYVLSRLLKKKVCSLTYGNDFLIKSKLSFQTFYIRNLDLLILGTNNMKDLIKKIHHLEDERLKVIRYGLNFEDYDVKFTKEELRKKFNISLNSFVILSVGRHVSRKNFDLVIKAISYIKKKLNYVDIKYFLIGEGETTQYLKELTRELELQNEIEFLGFTSKEKRNSFYKLSDLFIMPSSREPESIEGFGIVFLEANYFKCPVIGTFSGGINEAVINGETGLLVKQNNLNDLIEKILYMYNNKEKSKNMGIKGYKRVINEFDWNNIVNDYIETFNNLLERNSKI